MRKVSRVVSGVRLELVEGIRYRASRPFAERGRRFYPVDITPIDIEQYPTKVLETVETVTVDGLSYDAANELIAAFNNGPTSFEGRIW